MRQQDGEQSLDARHRGDLRVACVGERGKGAGAWNGGARSGGQLGGCRRCCEPRAREARWRGVRAGLERTPGHAGALSHAARLVRVRLRVRLRVGIRVRVRLRVRVRVRVRVQVSSGAPSRHALNRSGPAV